MVAASHVSARDKSVNHITWHVHVYIFLFFLSNPGQRLPLGWSRVANTWGRLLFFFFLFSSSFFPLERRARALRSPCRGSAAVVRPADTHVVPPCAHCGAYRWRSASAEVSPRSATLIDKGFFFSSFSLSLSHTLLFCQHLIISKDLQRPPVEILSLGISKHCRLLIASLNAQ